VVGLEPVDKIVLPPGKLPTLCPSLSQVNTLLHYQVLLISSEVDVSVDVWAFEKAILGDNGFAVYMR
jgi:hypothetical protein